MSLLPYSKSSIVDETRGITPAAPPPSVNIASFIVSDTGPTERLTITSQQDLIDNYCTGTLIPSDSHKSLLFNAALLTRAPVDIIRVSTSNIRVGVGSLGNTYYFNEYYELITNYTKFLMNASDMVDESIFYVEGEEDEDDEDTPLTYTYNELVAKLDGAAIPMYTIADDNKLAQISNLNGYNYFTETGKLGINLGDDKANEDNEAVIKRLTPTLAYYNHIYVSIDDSFDPNTKGKFDGLEINGIRYTEDTTLADLMGDIESLNSILSINNNVLHIYIPISNGVPVTVPGVEGSISLNTLYKLYSLDIPTMSEVESIYKRTYSLTIDGCKYTNDEDDVGKDDKYINGSTYGEFKSKLISELMSEFQIAMDKEGAILIMDLLDDITDGEGIKIKYSNQVTQDPTRIKDAFAIVSRFPTTMDLFSYSYSYDSSKEYKPIELTYKYKTNTNTITISMDSLSMDGYGNSLYYDKYNEGDLASPFIYIAKLPNYMNDNGYHKKTFTSRAFGSEITPLEVTDSAMAEAILKYKEYKDRQYNFIIDAGVDSVGVQNACMSISETRFAQYPVSIPSFNGKLSEIVSYVKGNRKDSFQAYYLYAPHKSNYTGNYLVEMPGSLIYLFARISMYGTTIGEFTPLFGTTKGAVAVPNPVKIFNSDSDAQQLADLNVNTLASTSRLTYIRSNFTSQMIPSYLSEEQYVYITNLICHICEEYNPSIHGEVNDSILWDSIITDLNGRISDRITSGKSPTISAFRVVCDETLNTVEVVESRTVKYQVWVQYIPTVAYTLAYTYVKRLGSF